MTHLVTAVWRTVRPYVASAVLIGAGIGLAFLVLHFHSVAGDAIVVALLFAPIVIYAIVSGRLSELSAGGLQAKFNAAARQTVAAATHHVTADEVLQLTAMDRVEELDRTLRGEDPDDPVVLRIELGLGKEYCERTNMLETAQRAAEILRNFRYVVFVTKDQRVLGYMPLWAFERCLQNEQHGTEFTAAINAGRADDVRRVDGFLDATLRSDKTNLDALREMEMRHVEALVVVNANGTLKGIVEREAVVSRMLLSLVS